MTKYIFDLSETPDCVPWKDEGEYIHNHQQASGNWVGVHVDARVKSDSWACGVGITPLSCYSHKYSFKMCSYMILLCFKCYLCEAGKTRNVIQAGISILFLWFVVHWHSDWEVPCSDMTVGGKHRHYCFIKYTTYLFIHSIGMRRMQQFLAVLRSSFHPSLLHTLSFHPFAPTSPPSSLTSHLPSISWSTSQPCGYQIHIQYFFGNSIFFHSLYMPKPL